MLRFIANSSIVLFLTVLTQIGGVAWLIALFFRKRIVAFILAYAHPIIGRLVDKETLEKMGASQGAASDVTKREDA